MDKSTGSPLLARMSLLHGELPDALASFRKLRDEYRRRFEEDGIALTQDEAVEAYKLVAPLYPPDMPLDEAARQAAMNAIAFRLESGGFVFRGPAVKAIIEGFEREIAEGSDALYIRHHGEAEAREEDSWSRFIDYEALEFFSAVLSACRITEGEMGSDFVRAQAILAKLTVNRPRGRHDPRLTLWRDNYIVIMLRELEGCGLTVTSRRGDSLAGALADVLGMKKRAIRKVWGDSELRIILAEHIGFIRHSRKEAPFNPALEPVDPALPNIIPDVQCAKCGKAGKVPMYRTIEGGSGLCTDCREW